MAALRGNGILGASRQRRGGKNLIEKITLKGFAVAGEAPDDDCSICIAQMRPGQFVVKLQCGHLFHKNCLAPWLQLSTYCPVCKANAKEAQV